MTLVESKTLPTWADGFKARIAYMQFICFQLVVFVLTLHCSSNTPLVVAVHVGCWILICLRIVEHACTSILSTVGFESDRRAGKRQPSGVNLSAPDALCGLGCLGSQPNSKGSTPAFYGKQMPLSIFLSNGLGKPGGRRKWVQNGHGFCASRVRFQNGACCSTEKQVLSFSLVDFMLLSYVPKKQGVNETQSNSSDCRVADWRA